MKKEITLFIIGIFQIFFLKAQDGSNIIYYDPENLDHHLIGKFCHIDFGKESFGGLKIDTITISIEGQPMRFYEHRKDNRFNNWFEEQYLIRVEDTHNSSTRLQHSRIDSLTSEKVYVTSILSYYNNESPIDTLTVFQHWYDRKSISKVLIKN